MKNRSLKLIKVIALFICGIVTLIYIFFLSQEFYNYYTLQKKVKEQRARLSQLKEETREAQIFLQEYKKEKEEFKTLLFKKRDIPSFLKKISEFAEKSEVKIIDMKMGIPMEVKPVVEAKKTLSFVERKKISSKKEKKELPYLSALPINIKIEGNFNSIVSFLIFLERYRQLLSVSNVTIREKKYPILSCRFTLRLYSLIEEENKEEN